jgi:hypothetical protein
MLTLISHTIFEARKIVVLVSSFTLLCAQADLIIQVIWEITFSFDLE